MNTIKSIFLCLTLMVTLTQLTVAASPRPMTWTVDGVQREALVFVPSHGSPQDKHPLVIAFHGHGGDMRQFAKDAALETHWPEAIVVYPQGLPTATKADPRGLQAGWQHTAGDERDRDLKFVDAMLGTLHSEYRVDEARVFATGFSNGAMFSLLLWTQRSDGFAGFAIVAGALDPALHLTVGKPVLQIAGAKDPFITAALTESTIAEERRVDEAHGPGRECGPGCTMYRGKNANVKVVMHPGEHVYPPQAAELTAEFFRAGSPTSSVSAPVATAGAVSDTPDQAKPKADIIQYKSRNLDLVAFVYKPAGNGPFPVYMWNHGGERDPMPGALLAKFWMAHGFILFVPLRAGHGPNPGSWIVDEQKLVREQRSPAGFRKIVALHEGANEDVIAAYNWIARQPYVDAKRIVVAGGYFGGIQALFTGERDKVDILGVKCLVVMAPAAESWANPHWAGRLTTAVVNARAPIFLLQASDDFSMGPSEVLGPRLEAKGFPNRHKIFPSRGGPDDAKKPGTFISDAAAWGDDVLAYLHDCGEM